MQPIGQTYIVSATELTTSVLPAVDYPPDETLQQTYQNGECSRYCGDICIIDTSGQFCSPYHYGYMPDIQAGLASGISYALIAPATDAEFFVTVILPTS